MLELFVPPPRFVGKQLLSVMELAWLCKTASQSIKFDVSLGSSPGVEIKSLKRRKRRGPLTHCKVRRVFGRCVTRARRSSNLIYRVHLPRRSGDSDEWNATTSSFLSMITGVVLGRCTEMQEGCVKVADATDGPFHTRRFESGASVALHGLAFLQHSLRANLRFRCRCTNCTIKLPLREATPATITAANATMQRADNALTAIVPTTAGLTSFLTRRIVNSSCDAVLRLLHMR